jgi:hypothetical protein
MIAKEVYQAKESEQFRHVGWFAKVLYSLDMRVGRAYLSMLDLFAENFNLSTSKFAFLELES